ncbi:MAG: Aspartate-semialdehyde dehydrogenase [Planctomycetes bacterium ADurb.Bin126]|nr:MAG: Aspartate-semialdehyde dehydrogenase [Planctomycetes bacterium ADurb.Bin126]HOD83722.1 aspartate-semialdehyde dehydrogenase [Phycisphaerae bacterium]HQL75885.1 aspartate-semialdehyde dehydrogenase [Phycisphaerae bacterium]
MNKHVAIMGATGAVGTEFLKILEQRKFPLASLKLLASGRSAGKKLVFAGEELVVEELTDKSFAGIDLVLASAGGSISKKFAPAAVAAGCVVVDNTSAFRMVPDVPLVVPEVNPEDIARHKGIIANPNCSTIIMNVPVWPLHKANPVKRLVISTYQAVSGAGAWGLWELEEQMRAYVAGQPIQKKKFPHQIVNNLFSHNSAVGEHGYNEEEIKMVNETRKIFHCPEIRVTATCIRVPVMRAHTEAINIEFAQPMSEAQAREVLSRAAGVTIVDDRAGNTFPMPLDASDQDDVLVGRIRQDISREDGCGIDLLVSGDQIRKGAALNAVQIAERL